MNAIVLQIIGWVLPIVLGPLVYVAARYALNANAFVDELPPLFKRVAVVALGTLTVAVLNVLGVAVPTECATPTETFTDCAATLNTPTVVRGVTAGVVAMVLHALKKSRPYA